MQNYKCKFCGAELFWNPDEGCLKCEYCESKYSPSEFEDATQNEETVTSSRIENEYSNSTINENMAVYKCHTCGGEVIAMETTMATICPYCGEAVSITEKSVGNFRPQLIVPFEQSKETIIELYKRYVKKSFLTPKKFKEEHEVEKIQGLFVPFYLHTVFDHAKHRFDAETTSSHRRGDDRVTVHRKYDLALIADGKFIRVPTDGAKRIDDKLMEYVEPFNYDELKTYNPAYMAGYLAEQIDEDEEKMNLRAEVRSKEGMTDLARSNFQNYSQLTLVHEEHEIKKHDAEYVMLPIWLLNIKHKGELYQFAINGQTGKVVGKLPMDIVKLIFVGLGLFVSLDVVMALVLYILTIF